MFCKLCQADFPNTHFFRTHKLSLSEYILKHEVRQDLLTGEALPFKSDYDKYIDTDFLNRNNLKKWLSAKSLQEQKDYCFNLLKKRVERKSLKYLPTHIELKSVLCPATTYLDDIFASEGGYQGLAAKLGLEKRFIENYYQNDKIPDNSTILIDTREQKPVKLSIPTKILGLKFGDYALEGKQDLVIERKSLSDFIGTLSSRNLERFEREIERAAESYIVILVEEPLNRALAFDKLPWISKQIRCGPDYIFGNVRELLQKYKNIQFLFCDGRVEMSRLIPIILNNQEFCREWDLQKLYDLKRL